MSDVAPDRVLELRVTVPLGALTLEVALETGSPAVAVVGPSGSGKTTLLRVIGGVEQGAQGIVRFGELVWQHSGRRVFVPPWERRVGWVPQDNLLFPHLSVRENLAYSGAAEAEVREMASLLEVEGLLHRRPRRLSGGEQQRVALGRALLSRPRLLLLDEPFSALDRPLRAQVAQRVKRFSEERDLPLVLVSHEERDAEALEAEEWLLSRGRLEPLSG